MIYTWNLAWLIHVFFPYPECFGAKLGISTIPVLKTYILITDKTPQGERNR